MDLSDMETRILIIIKEYLSKNRVFNAKKIIPYIMKGAKAFQTEGPLNEADVEKVIWRFIRERLIVPGSKLTKDNLLENYTRKAIFNHIHKNPGTRIREIMNKLEIGGHETLWHMNLLLKFALIRYAEIGNIKAYYDMLLPDSRDAEFYYLGNEVINEIIQILIMNGEGLTINKMSEELEIHFNTVTTGLNKLNEIQLLYQKEENGQTLYLLNGDLFKEIMKDIEVIRKKVT